MGTSLETISRHVPFERFTIAHPCVSVFELHREGLLVAGTSATLQTAYGGCLVEARGGQVSLDGQVVEIEPHPCFPCRVFVCPRGAHPCHKLFRVGGQWACYGHQGLTHASRHGAVRAMPNFRKLIALRRKIGADLRPLAPLPLRPPLARQYWRIARQIRELEAGLLAQLRHDVCDVLERAYERR